MTISEIIKKIIDVCVKNGYDYRLALRQCSQESGFNVMAESRVHAKGLFQFMPATFTDVYNRLKSIDPFGIQYKWNPDQEKSVYDVDTQIACHLVYMGVMIPAYLNHLNLPDTAENRLRAYNAGAGNVVKSHNFTETNDYISKIMSNYWDNKINNLAGFDVMGGGSAFVKNTAGVVVGIIAGIFLIG